MIRYKSSNQLKLEAFKTPFEMNMDPANRWVKLAQAIPWDRLASIYYRYMSVNQGAPTKDGRLVIGCLIIKHTLKLDDRGTIEIIKENPYMQYFLGLESYTSEPVFDPSLFVSIRNRIGQESFDIMTEALIEKSIGKEEKKERKEKKDDSSDSNKGKLIIDATVADSDIKYPTDLDLLNDSRKKSEELIDTLHKQLQLKIKPRTYRRKADKDFINLSKKKKKNRKEIRRGIKFQLSCLKRNIKTVQEMLNQFTNKPFPLNGKQQKYLFVLQHLYDQQSSMYKNNTHTCPNRIVNIHQPHVRPIVRGKAGVNVEFGAKIGLSLQNGYGKIDTLSWEAYNESSDLIPQVESFKRIHGHYPELVLADKIYQTRENRKYLKDRNIRIIGKPLGRPSKEDVTASVKRKWRKEAAQRNRIEGTFGLAKLKYGLNNIRAKLQKTSESWIAAIIFVMNIMKFCKEFYLPLFLALINDLLKKFVQVNPYILNPKQLLRLD